MLESQQQDGLRRRPCAAPTQSSWPSTWPVPPRGSWSTSTRAAAQAPPQHGPGRQLVSRIGTGSWPDTWPLPVRGSWSASARPAAQATPSAAGMRTRAPILRGHRVRAFLMLMMPIRRQATEEQQNRLRELEGSEQDVVAELVRSPNRRLLLVTSSRGYGVGVGVGVAFLSLGFCFQKDNKRQRADEGGLLLLTLKTTPLKSFTSSRVSIHAA